MKKQKVQAKINLEALAGGAFAEKLNEALMQVAENIQNPNNVADINVGNIPGGPSSPGKPKEDKNMLIINIVLALVAALLLFGVIGEKDGLRQQNITIAFVAVIVLIISLNRFF